MCRNDDYEHQIRQKIFKVTTFRLFNSLYIKFLNTTVLDIFPVWYIFVQYVVNSVANSNS